MDIENSRLKNAQRLLADANLLYEHERWASAYILAIYALEEVGRVIIERWMEDGPLPRAKRRFTFHVQKQLAVYHVALASIVLDKARAMEADGAPPPECTDWLEELRRRMESAPEFSLYYPAQRGWFETSKHMTLYRDRKFEEQGLHDDIISAENVDPIEQLILKALPSIDDNDHMCIARVNYEWAVSGTNSPRDLWRDKLYARRPLS